MENTILTYWYERGRQIIMTTEPGDHGHLVGTLDLTPDELREASAVPWGTCTISQAEADAKLPSARWLRVARGDA